MSKKRYLTFQEITSHLIGLGLADNKQFVQRLLVSIKQKRSKEQLKDEEIELLTLKQFMKVFEFDKFGERACQAIRQEAIEQATKDFTRQTVHMRDSFKRTIEADRGSPFKQSQLLSKDLTTVNQGRASRFSRVSSGSDLLSNDEMPSVDVREAELRSKFNQSRAMTLPSATTEDPAKKVSLAQKMALVKQWFELAKRKVAESGELKIEHVAELLVEKALVSDIDTGIKTIQKALSLKQKVDKFTFELFQRIFVRAIFKESLIEVIHDIKQDS